MQPYPGTRREALGLGCAVLLTPLAIWCTVSIAPFRDIPWTFSYLVLALAAELGGNVAAALSVAISIAGIDLFFLRPTHDTDVLLKVAAFVLTSAVITLLVRQRHRAVTRLQRSEAHHRTLTETATDVVLTLDADERILSSNPAVRTVFQWEPAEVVGQHLADLLPFEQRGPEPPPLVGQQLLTGRRRNGESFPVDASFASHITDGELRQTAFLRDVSERQKSEAALLQSEKLAAVGRLATSIAHEINNPLESVTNLLYLARNTVDPGEIQQYLETADQELRRVSAISSQTLRFHKQSTRPRPVLPEELLESVLSIFQGKIVNSRVVVQTRFRAQRPVECFDGEIRQVLSNLVGNAVDAMHPRGGRLLIRTRAAHHWRSGQPGTVFTIADTGSGMAPHIAAKIFEAFYTTKGINGTGLGLWVSKGIVDRHGGTLRVHSSEAAGKSGTIFTLFLPRVAATRQEPTALVA